MPEFLPKKTASVLALLCVCFFVLPRVMTIGNLPKLGVDDLIAAFSLPPLHKPEPVQEEPQDETPEIQAHAPIPHLIVPKGSLDRFFHGLRNLEEGKPGTVVRVLHYGDSPTTADSITADIRKILQDRFGNGGHGFVLLAKPWAWYGHRGIGLESKGWNIEAASMHKAPDGEHGLGGVSFKGQTGAWTRITLPDEQHSRITVHYWAQPGGGTISLTAGETVLGNVETAAAEAKPDWAEFSLPTGTKVIRLEVTAGPVRAFGVRLDRDGPGIQYSSLGINGAHVEMLLRSFEKKAWAAELQHENPDLLVLNYGTNESIYASYIAKQYPGDLRKIIDFIHQAIPNTPVLVMSPMDRGVLGPGGDVVTPDTLVELIAMQKKIADETGCAFFNTFEAMGGAGTMRRWYKESQPRLVSADFMHPLPQGAAKVGALAADALMKEYDGGVAK